MFINNLYDERGFPMKIPLEYNSKTLDINPDFRKVLKAINIYSGGKVYSSCSGHPINDLGRGNKKILSPVLGIRFNDLAKMNQLLDFFMNTQFVVAYGVNVNNWFHTIYPYKFGLVIHFHHTMMDKWNYILHEINLKFKG